MQAGSPQHFVTFSSSSHFLCHCPLQACANIPSNAITMVTIPGPSVGPGGLCLSGILRQGLTGLLNKTVNDMPLCLISYALFEMVKHKKTFQPFSIPIEQMDGNVVEVPLHPDLLDNTEGRSLGFDGLFQSKQVMLPPLALGCFTPLPSAF